MQEVSPHNIKKLAAIGMLGTSIEWYDFYIYGTAAALLFPTLFFPSTLPPFVALIAAFSTFAVGFVARPIGGIIFGHFGDKLGRKKALVVALVLMGTCTAGIGLLPSYATAGIFAPLLLIILRFAQGIAIGGQWGGAVLLITETAPSHRRGYYGAFAQAGVCVGIVLANLAFLITSSQLSQEDFMSWGWRIPFVLSVVLVAVALYIQLHLEDTPIFRQLQALAEERAKADAASNPAPVVSSSPVFDALRSYPKQIALAAGMFMALQVTFFITVTFVVAYGSSAAGLGLTRNTMLLAVLIGAAFMAPSVFWAASFSDRHGRRGIYIAGALLLAVWIFVFFPLIETKSFPLIVLGLSVTFILMGFLHGPHAAFLIELFRTKVRYSGASLGYQFGAIIGGGFAPLIATALVAEFGTTLAVSVYIAIACLITAFCVYLLEETHKRELHEIE